MLAFSPSNIRMWSKLGQRGAFGMAMLELCESDSDLVVLTADLGNTSGLDRYRERFPDKFYNLGIAENNMINVAAGLAKEGSNVFCTTFANFAAMRSYEQIRLSLGYMNFGVKVVGLGSGFAMGFFGNTHYGIEDLALMRAVPNLKVVSPADCCEVVKSVFACAELNTPCYIRLTGVMNNPIVYKQDYTFELGKAVVLKNEGNDIALIATGSTVYSSLCAAEILQQKGYGVRVVNMHTIKPIDQETILSLLDCKWLVSVEEHSVIGGLGGAIAEVISAQRHNSQLLRLGIADRFQKPGEYAFLFKENRLDADGICEQIFEKIQML